MIWRSLVAAAYVVWALVWGLALGGGAVVLAFFGVWGGVWLGFALFGRWADQRRRVLLRPHGHS